MQRSDRRPLERFVLDNGLRVVVESARSDQLVGVSVVYDVGFRSEPEERTGFAHLFEHMMFQGSAHVAKVEHMRLVEGAGGVFNGHTLADLTAYYEALPAGALELALWLEADRMGSLAVTEENLANQIDVVKEEINVNVLNQPYGGFPFILLPETAFDTFQNSHNGYGAFEHLERATIEEARAFYKEFYVPSNAVLCVTGGCDPGEVAHLAENLFGDLPLAVAPPHGARHEEALSRPRRRSVDDPRAPQPAFAAGYRTPDPVAELERHLVYFVLAQVLTRGDASRLRARLVHQERVVTDISCMLGVFGSDNYFMRDPVLFQTVVMHPGLESTEEIMSTILEELTRLAADGPSDDELRRVAAGYSSSYWHGLDSVMERSIALASLEAIHGRGEILFELPSLLAAVSPAEVAAAAADLAAQHPAVVEIRPGVKAGRAGGR